MMGPRIPTRSGDERDAVTAWRHNSKRMCKAKIRARLKRALRRRERHAEARIAHLESCLLHISDTTDDPDLAQFAFRASGNPPDAFPPERERTCIYCGRPGGAGPRELRPYGPGGTDVCAECTFKGPPERLKEAERQLGERLLSGPLLLDTREQVGPRPIKKGDT